MAERSLKKNRGNMRIAVVRPSVIISCYDEPFVGWTDTVAGAGGLLYSIHAGLMHNIYTLKTKPLDLVPCDIVVSTLLL